MASPKNGELRIVRLAIVSAFAELITPTNADGSAKVGNNGKPQMWYIVTTQQPHPITGEKVVWITQGNAEKLAKATGATSAAMVRNAIAAAFEPCYIDVTIKYCEVGGNITDDDGEDKLDDSGKPIDTYKGTADGDSYWQEVSRKFALVLSEDAAEYIADINAKLDLEEAREMRNADKAKIVKLKSSAGTTILIEKAKAKDDEDDEDEDDEDLAGGGKSPAMTKAEMKAANKAAKTAGQPAPYTAAQIAAGK